MSLKIQNYTNVNVGPQTSNLFEVSLFRGQELFQNIKFLISNASIPFITYKSDTIYRKGLKVVVPTLEEVSGKWSCMLDENVSMDSLNYILALQDMISRDETTLFDIHISLLDFYTRSPLVTVILRDCWLESVQNVNLSWDSIQAIKYNLTFVYNNIDYVQGL